MNFSVVVPAYNESENLKLLIPRLDKALTSLGCEYEIIVVDNASTDNTQNTLKTLSQSFPSVLCVFEPKKGFGNAVLAGLNSATGEILGYIHADNQMEPSDLVRIYHKFMKDGLDVCKATRLDRHDGFVRWIVTKVYNFLFKIMFGAKIRDINGSPKLFTREFFRKAGIESKDWFIDPEIVIKAARLNSKIGEVEIYTAPRRHGASQVKFKTVMEFLKNMFYYWLA